MPLTNKKGLLLCRQSERSALSAREYTCSWSPFIKLEFASLTFVSVRLPILPMCMAERKYSGRSTINLVISLFINHNQDLSHAQPSRVAVVMDSTPALSARLSTSPSGIVSCHSTCNICLRRRSWAPVSSLICLRYSIISSVE